MVLTVIGYYDSKGNVARLGKPQMDYMAANKGALCLSEGHYGKMARWQLGGKQMAYYRMQ